MSMSYPYPFLLHPDYKSALIAYLRTIPQLTAVVAADHIVGRVEDATGHQTENWLAIVAAGGRDSVYTVPMSYPHLQAHCMGTNGYESMRMWRTMKSGLEHPSYRMQGFIAQGCMVYDVRVGLPLEQPDLGIRPWDKRVCPVYLTINEVPIS